MANPVERSWPGRLRYSALAPTVLLASSLASQRDLRVHPSSLSQNPTRAPGTYVLPGPPKYVKQWPKTTGRLLFHILLGSRYLLWGLKYLNRNCFGLSGSAGEASLASGFHLVTAFAQQ